MKVKTKVSRTLIIKNYCLLTLLKVIQEMSKRLLFHLTCLF